MTQVMAAEVVRPRETANAAPIYINDFDEQFRELNDSQCETAHRILYMMLAVMEVKVDR